VSRDEVRDLGRLRRSTTDRMVAGVAGGLARHLDVDPLLLRVAFVVLVFFGGAGLILYGACWLLVPEDGHDRATVHLDERSRTIALAVVGVLAALALVGDSWGAFGFPWPLAIVALVALWLLTRNSPAASAPSTSGPVAPPQAAVAPSYPPTPAPAYSYVPPRPDPRKRGPLLFWATLALVALGEGLLAIVDLAGVDVPASAYPALAVGLCGLVLVTGAFFGRAGGVILLGLVATAALTLSTAAERWDGDDVHATPTSAADVDGRYYLGAGEQVIDLREVADPERLDGRTIRVEGGVGRIEVVLPDGVAATVHADLDGFGALDLLGEEHSGVDVHESVSDGSARDPHVVIDAQLGVGQIEVKRP
jgi:phage shock protein PspC (stress-responsive transcriptional regulator)